MGAPDNTLMAAGVELQVAGVRLGAPEPLFRLPPIDEYAFFQPSRDGRRFLVYEMPGVQQERPMVVKLNWAAGLDK